MRQSRWPAPRSQRAVRRHYRRRAPVTAVLVIAAIACAAPQQESRPLAEVREGGRLDTAHVVFLESPPSYPFVDPIAVAVAPNGDYIVGDRSERAVWRFSNNGQYKARVIEAGQDHGRVRALYGAVVLNDEVGAFDVLSSSVTFVDADGKLNRVITLPFTPRWRPRSVTAVDDTTLLVVHHPGDSPNRRLLRFIDARGLVQDSLVDRGDYYNRNSPIFTVLSMPLADSKDDLVLVGFSGHDSLFAFHRDGRPLAQSRLQTRDFAIRDFETVAQEREGKLSAADLPELSEEAMRLGITSLSQVLVLDSVTAIAQLDFSNHGGPSRRPFGSASVLVPLRIDRASGAIQAGSPLKVTGALVGRTSAGQALLLRPTTHAERSELVRLSWTGGE